MSHTLPGASSEAIQANTPFADYYAEFNDVVTSVQTAIASAQGHVQKDPTRATDQLVDTDRLLDEATDLLDSMELEVQSLDKSSRTKLRPHVLAAREKMTRLRSAIRAARMDVDAAEDGNARTRLLADGADRDQMRMSDATTDLEAASRSIVDSRRHVSETEAVGSSILQDLQEQRATIMRARNNLGTVETGLDQSSSILSTMQRRTILNRIVIYIVGAAIGISCLAVLYLRLFRYGGES